MAGPSKLEQSESRLGFTKDHSHYSKEGSFSRCSIFFPFLSLTTKSRRHSHQSPQRVCTYLFGLFLGLFVCFLILFYFQLVILCVSFALVKSKYYYNFLITTITKTQASRLRLPITSTTRVFIPSTDCHTNHLTLLMTSAQVVETSVKVNLAVLLRNSPTRTIVLHSVMLWFMGSNHLRNCWKITKFKLKLKI